MLDDVLEKLCQDYFEYSLEYFPPMATHMGIHKYDEEMPEGSLESVKDYQKKTRELYKKITEIDPEKLTFDGKINRAAVMHSLKLHIFEEDVHGRWRSKLELGTVLGTALHSLFISEFAPFDERIRLIASRLDKFPAYLQNNRQLLSDPVKLWTEIGIEECESIEQFIRIVQAEAREQGVSEKYINKLNSSAQKAVEALKDCKRWLANDVLPRSREEFAMKPEEFERLIELRELGMSTSDLLEFGQQAMEAGRENLKKIAGEIAPGEDIRSVRNLLMKNHPATFADALEETQKAVKRSRQFVIDSKYATLPEGEELIVIETPNFARHIIPFGAYMPPGKFEREQKGHYWMSRPQEEKDQTLAIHNMGSILNTSVHEGYPGHHLQLVCANTNPYYSRLLTMGVEFVEGWAHYCEEKVSQMGFSTEPEVMFERYNDIIWRAARIMVDVKLSRGEMGIEEAVNYLQEMTGFDRHSCITEVRRYTFSPGYQLSYLVGKKLIMDIAQSVEKEAGERFDLGKFHDAMLYAGNLPLKYMEKVVKEAFKIEKAGV